jgi:hypothetical protein
MTTFLEFAQNIADRLDEDYPSTIYASDMSSLSQTIRRYRRNINLAYHLVWSNVNRKNEYREAESTITLVVDTESYNIPTGITSVSQVKIGTDPPLPISTWEDFERYKSEATVITTTGTPNTCAIWKRKIWFYPIPDEGATAYIRGTEGFTKMDLDTDTPDLAEELHPAIEQFGIFYEMVYEGNPQAGMLATAENGLLQAQGGQAAIALNTLNMAKKTIKQHYTQAPRMLAAQELAEQDVYRRIVRA